MDLVSTQSEIHKRFKAFVKWIAPEPETRTAIHKQADEIRDKITAKAEADRLIVISRPFSGSFDKITGLRRYMRGDTVVEGQDIDIAFIMSEYDKEGKKQGCLVERFRKYAEDSYPDSEVSNTKSSATIKFESTKLRYDLVPLFETSRPNIQLLKRTNGKERTTSVVKHSDFIKDRTKSSDELPGVVKFNECERLIKWWKYHQQENSGIFGNEDGDEKVPSFLLDLLCASSYDNRSVDKTYAGTLAMWFGYLANTVRNRKSIFFNKLGQTAADLDSSLWKVIDPIDPSNNLVKNWDNAKINELARWFENARDEINRAIRYDEQEDDVASLESLVKIFGNAFKNYCQ